MQRARQRATGLSWCLCASMIAGIGASCNNWSSMRLASICTRSDSLWLASVAMQPSSCGISVSRGSMLARFPSPSTRRRRSRSLCSIRRRPYQCCSTSTSSLVESARRWSSSSSRRSNDANPTSSCAT